MTGPEPRQYTATEKAKLTWLVARAVKQGAAKVDAQIEAVKAQAVERERIEDMARAKVAGERLAEREKAAIEKAARKYRR